MTGRYPRVRFDWDVEGERYPSVRESVSICFYMRRPHREVAPAVMRALEAYRRAIAPHTLAWYPDMDGDWRELDKQGWEINQRKVQHPQGGTLRLRASPELITDYEFRYHGMALDASPFNEDPGATCAAAFWLPTEYLEAQGPAQVRRLALELGSELPFNSGHAGLSFYFTEDMVGISDPLRGLSFRHPGMDMPAMENLPMKLGTRIKGASWLTFLGLPILDSLGGPAGLRARLHAATTGVEEVGAGRAVVTLGEWPEAGDLEHGKVLPEYRELARVLEPWLYQAPRSPWSGFTDEDVRRWERRFL